MNALTGQELIEDLPAKERSAIELAVYKYFAVNYHGKSKSTICKMADNIINNRLCDITGLIDWQEIVK